MMQLTGEVRTARLARFYLIASASERWTVGRSPSEVQETTIPARKTDKTSKPAGRKPAKRVAALGEATTPLPESMVTGKASPAKATVGDQPVFAYIASLPQPQRGIAERVDALAAKTLPDLQRSVKWGMSEPPRVFRRLG